MRSAIVKSLRKLQNNLLSGRAVSVLGPALYARYLATFCAHIPRVVGAGDLRPLDKAMGVIAKEFRYRASTFLFDCHFCDEHLEENSFAFGIVREIFIRDCYFRWHPSSVYDRARAVIDLGANRGAFSTLMTTRAEFILSVECGGQYAPIIRHNMDENHHTNYAIETAFVGAGGSAESTAPKITIDGLFRRYGIESVDLIKMDIEGSEFALFNDSADWLHRVNAISMEVHPRYGDPHGILRRMAQYGFTCAMANEDLQATSEVRHASFIYAWKSP